jgi:hypothetical protein
MKCSTVIRVGPDMTSSVCQESEKLDTDSDSNFSEIKGEQELKEE